VPAISIAAQRRSSMPFPVDALALISKRHSCRSFESRPVDPAVIQNLRDFLNSHSRGPFGHPVRAEIVAAGAEDSAALKGLGAYGIIKSPAFFIVPAIRGEIKETLVDCGYVLEMAVLYAADLGLGTCWIGGMFTRSAFASKIHCSESEKIPAVIAGGYPSQQRRLVDSLLRWSAKSSVRKAWSELFFRGTPGAPLDADTIGQFAQVLEAVRRAPSASNKQPWRIIRSEEGKGFHFYLSRTPGYHGGISRLIGMSDIQLIDMGIAIAHFDLAAQALGIAGKWMAGESPHIHAPGELEYITTWQES
jgi:nitroreductase